jgi:hypothetical protein
MAEEIVSYPEYEEFMKELARFHEEKGTAFRAEPILGGKKIDLCRLYKLVTERGGMDRVSEERRWRKIGEEFQLPETCTSSAYVLKDVYLRYLKDYETIMMSTNRDVTTATTTRDHEERLPSSVVTTSPSSPLTSSSSSTSSLSFRPMKSLPMSSMMVKPSITSIPTPMTNLSMTPTDNVVVSIPPSTRLPPSQWTIDSMEKKMKLKAEENFRGARRSLLCQPRTLLRDGQNKIRLALLSGLDAEIEWALQKLMALSYVCEEEFAVSDIPDLLDVLMQTVDGFLWEFNDRQSYDPLYTRPKSIERPLFATALQIDDEDDEQSKEKSNPSWYTQLDTTRLGESRGLLRRVLQVALILRNFSVMDVNKRVILNHAQARLFICKGALLQGTTDLEELRTRCMDILECLASHYRLSGPGDILLGILMHYLASDDRARIMVALYILLDLTAHQRNDESLLGSARHDKLWQTLYNFVVMPDHDLREMAEEILYRLSQIDEMLEQHILVGHPLGRSFKRSIESRSVGLDRLFFETGYGATSLTNLPSTPSTMMVSPWAMAPSPPSYATLSDRPVSSDSTLNSAREWLKRSFEEAPNFLVQYPRMYWAYVEAIQNQTNDPRKTILDERTFFPLLQSLFPDAALQLLRRQGHPEYFISGIRVRQQRIDTSITPSTQPFVAR